MACGASVGDDGPIRMDHRCSNIIGRFYRPLARQDLSQRCFLERCPGFRGCCGWLLGGVEKDEQRMSASILFNVIAYGTLGIALGAAFFAALRLNVRLYCDGASVWKTLLVHLLRIVSTGSAFTFLARHGALPLMSAFGGFVVMRAVSLRQQDHLL
jgi:F1F0 ATPase subunit 2